MKKAMYLYILIAVLFIGTTGSPVLAADVQSNGPQVQKKSRLNNQPEGNQISEQNKKVQSLVEKFKLLSDKIFYTQLNLASAEPYIAMDSKLWRQSFDAQKARQSGMSEEVIDLVVEVIDFQNELFSCSDSINGCDLKFDQYPQVLELFTQAAERIYLQEELKQIHVPEDAYTTYISPTIFNSCGTYLFPVPNYTPPRYGQCMNDPRGYLRSIGFHQTRCMAGDSKDYTRDRSYSSSYGYCSSPRFRDQGRVEINGPGTLNIQYGEPNPEVCSYWPPYWDWPAYVAFWHAIY